jgi:hypothetical protein
MIILVVEWGRSTSARLDRLYISENVPFLPAQFKSQTVTAVMRITTTTNPQMKQSYFLPSWFIPYLSPSVFSLSSVVLIFCIFHVILVGHAAVSAAWLARNGLEEAPLYRIS